MEGGRTDIGEARRKGRERRYSTGRDPGGQGRARAMPGDPAAGRPAAARA